MIITHPFKIDILLNNNYIPTLNFKQTDTNSHKLLINLLSNGAAQDLTNNTAKIYFKKADKTEVFQDCNIESALNGQISCVLTSNTLAVAGLLLCEISIYGTDNSILATITFNINVIALLRNDAAIQSSSEFTALTNALVTVNQYDSRITSVETQLAEKANQVDVNNQIASSQRVIINYNGSLANLQLNNVVDKTKNFLILDSTDTVNYGYVCYWNGSTWIAGWKFQNAGIADNSVTLRNTTFASTTENLFDKNAVTAGYSVSPVDGTISPSTGNNVVEFIPITAGEYYSRNKSYYHLAFYDTNKTFISGIVNTANIACFVAPADGYLRATIGDSDLNSLMIVKGYNPYLPTSLRSFIPYRNLNLSDNGLSSAVSDNIFDNKRIISNKYMGADGSFASNSTALWMMASEYIEIKPSTRYAVLKYNINTKLISIENGRFATYQADGTVVKAYNNVLMDFTTESNAKYVAFNTSEAVENTGWTSRIYLYMLIEFNGVLPSNYINNKSLIYLTKEMALKEDIPDITTTLKGNWLNKKYTSFGDSVTALNNWQPSVASKLGLTHTLRGIGGTTVANTGSIAYVDANGNYMDRPPNPKPDGSTQIYSSFCADDRVNTIPTDTQVITIMGGPNDYGQNVPLGTINDTVDTTFYGGYITLLNKLYARIPNARVVIMTQIYEVNSDVANSAGFTSEDYRKATRDIANKFGYPLVELKPNMGVNELNYSTYLSDGVHPNTTGANRLAEIVIGRFKDLEPLS